MAAAPIAERLIRASRRLAREAGGLKFGSPVGHVYNPLLYARRPHEAYVARFASTRKRVVLLGMNPGPWGMAQTGVPFGAIPMVRDWLEIHGPVKAPVDGHPRVVVKGFDCPRREVSGMRLWGLLRDEFRSPEAMARDMFVSNYCPLMFLDEGGRNVTPDRIGRSDQPGLFHTCDRFLREVLDALRPDWLVGVGLFAEGRARAVVEATGLSVKVTSIPHPSPANPRSQKDWPGQAAAALVRAGVWHAARIK